MVKLVAKRPKGSAKPFKGNRFGYEEVMIFEN
jgi:hypothetical protein